MGLCKLVDRTLKSCPHCRQRTLLNEIRRPEAPLHVTRVPMDPKLPFSEIGVDLLGHFMVKHGNSRASSKRWVLIFTCCWTRAVSLQVVQTESCRSTHLAFERHCAQFGTPRRVNSDGGGNFIALKDYCEKQWQVVQDTLKQLEIHWPLIEWRINPAHSPRFGGHFEILVKSTKNAMKKVLATHRTLDDEEFGTVVAKSQSYLNRRPLNCPSGDGDDKQPLTPEDFLMSGSRFRDLLPMGVDQDVARYSKTLKPVLKALWEALEVEFISKLTHRRKTVDPNYLPMRDGDYVYIISTQAQIPTESKSFPGRQQSVLGRYKVGRIFQAQPGRDGVDRVFYVKHGPARGGKLQITKMSYMNVVPVEVPPGKL